MGGGLFALGVADSRPQQCERNRRICHWGPGACVFSVGGGRWKHAPRPLPWIGELSRCTCLATCRQDTCSADSIRPKDRRGRKRCRYSDSGRKQVTRLWFPLARDQERSAGSEATEYSWGADIPGSRRSPLNRYVAIATEGWMRRQRFMSSIRPVSRMLLPEWGDEVVENASRSFSMTQSEGGVRTSEVPRDLLHNGILTERSGGRISALSLHE